jgi:hypothetical protein
MTEIKRVETEWFEMKQDLYAGKDMNDHEPMRNGAPTN